MLGEGLWWSSREDALYWTDIIGQRLSRLSLASGVVDDWAMPEMVGWLIERERAPGFVAGFASGIKTLTLEPFTTMPFADLPGEPEGNRLNDASANSAGRLWCGTMPISGDRPTGSFYRVDTDATVSRVERGYTIANGPAISADGRWLYHTDTVLGLVYRFALEPDGTLGPRVIWLEFQQGWGKPDGMICDADGGVWIAHWGGSRVTRFAPDGMLDRCISLPTSQITNCCFAGSMFDRMFVTSAADGVDEPYAGALFEVDPGCCGVAPYQFAG